MRIFYKNYKSKSYEYFFYLYWVRHNGFGRPKLVINKRHTEKAKFIFLFTCYKLECYLVKANKSV